REQGGLGRPRDPVALPPCAGCEATGGAPHALLGLAEQRDDRAVGELVDVGPDQEGGCSVGTTSGGVALVAGAPEVLDGGRLEVAGGGCDPLAEPGRTEVVP